MLSRELTKKEKKKKNSEWSFSISGPLKIALPKDQDSQLSSGAAAPRVRESSEALGTPTSTYRSTLKQQCIQTHVQSAIIN
jgi:hypothetical protein